MRADTAVVTASYLAVHAQDLKAVWKPLHAQFSVYVMSSHEFAAKKLSPVRAAFPVNNVIEAEEGEFLLSAA